jgi:DNA sulfur modification protein DndD
MFLRSIQLRDWKAFTKATVDFPVPTKTKNVCLIGAKNGFGKTSLLEALILGLYGRDAMGVLSRAVADSNGDSDRSYDEFLQRGLHAQALAQGRNSITIEVVLEEGDEHLRIQRRWHFSGDGRHRRNEEDIQVFTGQDEEPMRVPGFKPSREDREDFFRGLIAQRFLPWHLAEFFLFDGERVQKLARRDMAKQVKSGIEGILGVQVLRDLQQDLRDYASHRRSGVERIEDTTLSRVQAQITEIEARLEPLVKERKALESRSKTTREKRDALMKSLRTMTGGGMESVRELHENKLRFSQKKTRIEERLVQILHTDLAVAMAGRKLLSRVRETIQGEVMRSQWLAGKEQTRDGLPTILAGLRGNEPPVSPPLSEAQLSVLCERVRVAWESLWHPPPPGCAEEFRHSYLAEADRTSILSRLDKVDRFTITELGELLADHEEARNQIDRLTQEIAQLSGVEDRIKEVSEEIEKLNGEDRSDSEKISSLRRQEESDHALLNQKRPELARYQERFESAQPNLTRAAQAESISTLIGEAIEDLYPIHVQRLSEEMTTVYHRLAHKGLVKRIEISPDCSVRLLGDRGRDIRDMDLSAGEEQIFALSLIAAIARVSGASVPVVMDTPLARLDTDHRTNVLKYFASQVSGQVIFLSQPDEVHGPYLNVIRNRLAVSYQIEFEELGDGVGRAKICPGYFEPEEE